MERKVTTMGITAFQSLLNAGSSAMNTTAQKTFSYSPANGKSQVRGLSIILKDEGNTDLSRFGALAALTNGLLIQCTLGGVTRTIATLKTNGDLATMFEHNHFGNSAVLSILSVVTAEGFGNSTNIFKGFTELTYPIELTDADTIQAVVQDNLTSIDFLQMMAKVEVD